ncbi:13678_t:CDS:2, partial [Ambispora leptoticha]
VMGRVISFERPSNCLSHMELLFCRNAPSVTKGNDFWAKILSEIQRLYL